MNKGSVLTINNKTMQTKKFKIVETVDYYFAVSDEEIEYNNYFHLDMSNTGHPDEIHKMGNDKWSKTGGINFSQPSSWTALCKKIVAYLPKNNAPELLYDVKIPSDENVNMQKVSRLPLLPEMHTVIGQPLESYIKERHNQDKVLGFIDGWEASNKQYSEQDLRKAIQFAYNKGLLEIDISIDEIINQCLNQPKTPNHFEAEFKGPKMIYSEKYETMIHNPNCYKLKTELINGKETLVGNYLFE